MLAVYIRGPETNYSRSNIYDGNMTAQWSGKMRNVQDFDHAFTDVSSRPSLNRNAKIYISVRFSGRDHCTVEINIIFIIMIRLQLVCRLRLRHMSISIFPTSYNLPVCVTRWLRILRPAFWSTSSLKIAFNIYFSFLPLAHHSQSRTRECYIGLKMNDM